MGEVQYSDSFSITCEKELTFNSTFPYWKVPGTHYPSITERKCINALECPAKQSFGETVADTFDGINFVVDDSFLYYCRMNSLRGTS